MGTTDYSFARVAPTSTYSQSHPAYNQDSHCQACNLAQQLERGCSYDGTYKSPEDIRREFDELSRGDKLIIDFLKLRAAPWADIARENLVPEIHLPLNLTTQGSPAAALFGGRVDALVRLLRLIRAAMSVTTLDTDLLDKRVSG